MRCEAVAQVSIPSHPSGRDGDAAAQGREPVCPRCECKPCACDQPAAHTECRFTPAWQPGTDSNLQRAGIGCTCEWDADGNPIGGHKPPCRMASAATPSWSAGASALRSAKVLPFHRHEPALKITKQSGMKVESVICPCKVCGKLMEFPVEADDAS